MFLLRFPHLLRGVSRKVFLVSFSSILILAAVGIVPLSAIASFPPPGWKTHHVVESQGLIAQAPTLAPTPSTVAPLTPAEIPLANTALLFQNDLALLLVTPNFPNLDLVKGDIISTLITYALIVAIVSIPYTVWRKRSLVTS